MLCVIAASFEVNLRSMRICCTSVVAKLRLVSCQNLNVSQLSRSVCLVSFDFGFCFRCVSLVHFEDVVVVSGSTSMCLVVFNVTALFECVDTSVLQGLGMRHGTILGCCGIASLKSVRLKRCAVEQSRWSGHLARTCVFHLHARRGLECLILFFRSCELRCSRTLDLLSAWSFRGVVVSIWIPSLLGVALLFVLQTSQLAFRRRLLCTFVLGALKQLCPRNVPSSVCVSRS